MIYFVRVGVMGQIGRFQAVDTIRLAPTTRVILRSARGLEVGELLSLDEQSAQQETDGTLLRAMTDSDDLLAERLDRNRHSAFEACVSMLQEEGSEAILLDVEHLFDGKGLYFYFLGEADRIAESLTADLAETYDAEAKFQQFAETLTEGCGPGCGTPEASGGACSGGCATCSVASRCATK